MYLTVAVTGHRNLVETETAEIRGQVKSVLKDLQLQFPGLELQVLSALAEGADQLVANIALEMGFSLLAVLPYGQSLYEQSFLSPAGVDEFRRLLGKARVIDLPPVSGVRPADLEHDENARQQQYAQVGVFISNHCQVLLALWDGKDSGAMGGTSGVVHYHLTGVMPGYKEQQRSPSLLTDNENDLAWHLVCSRDQPGGEPESSLKPLASRWLTSRQPEPHEEMPEEYREMLNRLEAFDIDQERLEDADPDYSDLLAGSPELERPKGIDFVNDLFGQADWLARSYQRRFVRGLMVVHLLAICMGAVFIVYSEFGGPQFLVWLFLALFSAGVMVNRVGDRREWHRKYLDYRALAEGLRVQTYWSLAGVVATRSADFAYDNFLLKQDTDLAWIRHVMRTASLVRDRIQPPDDGWVDWVSQQWVGDRERQGGQLGYYARTADKKAELYNRTSRIGALALWGGITVALLMAVFSPEQDTPQYLVYMILMGLLPLTAAVRDTYSHKRAEKELIKQYQFMHRVFEKAWHHLQASDDLQFKRQVLQAVGTAALEEHAEWLLMHRERPLEHGRL